MLRSEIYIREDMDSLSRFSFFSLNQTDKYILMELPLGQLPSGVDKVIYDLKMEGITPIIAHPERSVTERDQLKDIENFLRLGALMQINPGSLLDHSGRFHKKATEWLLEMDLAHIMASDAHNPSHRCVALLPQALKKVS